MIEFDIYKQLRGFALNLELRCENEVLVLQGKSGAGKTSILDMIAGIKKPDDGWIKIQNEWVYNAHTQIDMPIRQRGVGYVVQNYALFPHLTVAKNIAFGLKCQGVDERGNLDDIMDRFQIHHLKNQYPHRISGGEKQRVALARALVMNPKVLLLDEPFAALDPETKRLVHNAFLRLKESLNMSVVLVTHNLDEAELLGDRIVEISEGKAKEL